MGVRKIRFLIRFRLRPRLLCFRINESEWRVAHRDFVAQRTAVARIFDNVRQGLPIDRPHERRLMQVMDTVIVIQMQRAQTVAVFLQQRELLLYRSREHIAMAGIIAEIDNGRGIARQSGLDRLPCIVERVLQCDAHAFLLQPRHQFVQRFQDLREALALTIVIFIGPCDGAGGNMHDHMARPTQFLQHQATVFDQFHAGQTLRLVERPPAFFFSGRTMHIQQLDIIGRHQPPDRVDFTRHVGKIAREMMAPMQMRETCLANQPDRLFGRPCAADVIRCDGKLCHVRCPFY